MCSHFFHFIFESIVQRNSKKHLTTHKNGVKIIFAPRGAENRI